MVKIGILTYPLNNNYGCYLQSYALLHFLQEKGYEVEYIYRRHDKPSWKTYIRYALKTLAKNIRKGEWDSFILNYEWNYMLKKGKDLYPFFEHYIVPHTQPLYTTSQLKKQCLNYDIIIVGSDQVWRAEILSNVEDYFLIFLKNKSIKRIAYAASFGKDNPGFSESQKISCGIAISNFYAVSVREDSGLNIIKKYHWTCPPCEVVLDPTLLLNKEEYLDLLREKSYPSIIFGYLLDHSNEKTSIMDKVSQLLHTEAFDIIQGTISEDFVYPPIEKWLGYLSNAKFVVTDSFHGMVFSILFNKPFVVIVNHERGAVRFLSFLKFLKLEDRIVDNASDITKVIETDINWEEVNAELNKKKRASIDFLLRSINNR